MRLIDADALINELNNSHYPGAPYIDAGISIAIGKVCDAPTIEAEPHWIPCKERLPDQYGNYLISIDGEEPDIGTINPNDPRGWSLCDANGFYWASDKALNITAWMPLPEPYKGEQG